jgi:hypothetical protein
MACAPLEGWLTTTKVKGTEEINGCCCCMDLRGGVLTMSGVFVRPDCALKAAPFRLVPFSSVLAAQQR